MKPKAIIFDLDGVLVDSSSRFKRLNLDAYNRKDSTAYIKSVTWYNADCRGDVVIDLGLDLLHMLITFYKPEKVFFITARGSGGHTPTLNWLKEENIWDGSSVLVTRPENYEHYEFETQADHAEYKKATAKKIMQDYDIIYAVDDSEFNVQAFASLGIPTIKFMVPVGRVLV